MFLLGVIQNCVGARDLQLVSHEVIWGQTRVCRKFLLPVSVQAYCVQALLNSNRLIWIPVDDRLLLL